MSYVSIFLMIMAAPLSVCSRRGRVLRFYSSPAGAGFGVRFWRGAGYPLRPLPRGRSDEQGGGFEVMKSKAGI